MRSAQHMKPHRTGNVELHALDFSEDERYYPRCNSEWSSFPRNGSCTSSRRTTHLDILARLSKSQGIANMHMSQTLSGTKVGHQCEIVGSTALLGRPATVRPRTMSKRTMAEANGASSNGKVCYLSIAT